MEAIRALPERLASLATLLAAVRTDWGGESARERHKTRENALRWTAHTMCSAEQRQQLCDALVDWTTSTRGIDASLKTELREVMSYLEADYSLYPPTKPTEPLVAHPAQAVPEADVTDEVVDEAALPLLINKKRLVIGASAMAAPLAQSAVFTDKEKGERVLRVLGMKNTYIERSATPLDETHLEVTAWLVSQVDTWSLFGGAVVVFNPWDLVRKLRWTVNNASIKRLLNAIEALAATTVRVVVDGKRNETEAASIVGYRRTALAERKEWRVQVNGVFLRELLKRPALVQLETLAALPSGLTTWLYGFVQSLPAQVTTWNVEDLCATAGVFNARARQLRYKLSEALETLQAGVAGDKLFEPVLQDFKFEAARNGKLRVRLTKA